MAASGLATILDGFSAVVGGRMAVLLPIEKPQTPGCLQPDLSPTDTVREAIFPGQLASSHGKQSCRLALELPVIVICLVEARPL